MGKENKHRAARTCEDEQISRIAALSMYYTVLFLLFQIIVLALLGVETLVLFPYLGIVPGKHGDLYVISSFLVCEAVLAILLWKYVKHKFLPLDGIVARESRDLKPLLIKEEHLERLFNIAAILGIVWILLMRMPWESIRIFIIVVHGFGLFFFTIFLVVRAMMTHELATRTFVSMFLSAGQIYLAVNGSLL